MKKQLLYLIIIILFSGTTAFSQQKLWTLDECINHAIDNNIKIRQQHLQTQNYKNSLVQSKMKLLPSLNASASENISWGRTADPTTYEFSDQRFMSNYFYLGGSMDIFNGLQNYNSIKKNQYEFLAGQQYLEALKENTSINVALYYLQILMNKELVMVIEEQLQVTLQQIEKTEKFVEAGSKARGDLLQIESQAAQEEVQLITLKNVLDLWYLDLTQLLEMPTPEGFEVAAPVITVDAGAVISETVEDIFMIASGSRPAVKSSELKVTASEYDLRAARGMRSPSLRMSHLIETRYSDRNQDPFKDQFRNNRNYGVGFSLSLPILNGWQTNTRISNAKISVENAKYTLDDSKKQLYKAIQQAHQDASAALKKIAANQKAVTAEEEAFRYIEQKFEVGLVTPVEYNNSKRLLLKAQSDLVQAKYEYVFKTKILDFYKGIPLSLN